MGRRMGRSADGGANFAQARNFGTIRLPGSRGIGGAISPGEGTDWFRVDIASKRLRFGSFSYAASDTFIEIQAQVNLFFRPGNRGRLQRVESFPAVSDSGSVQFSIKSPGSFYIQLSAQPVTDDLFYGFSFSAFERETGEPSDGEDLFN